MHPALIFIVASLATAAESATDVLKARDVQIRKTLPASGELTTAERSRLQDAVMKIVDTEAMAKASLGKTWESESRAEQKRFLKVFDSRLRQAVTQEVDFFNASQVEYLPEKQLPEGTEVPTRMTVKGDVTEVDYVLKQISGGWRIVDIVVDDASTTQSYRSSFGKVIAKEGWDGLIAQLSKGKAEKAGAEPKGTP
jgi:phospholipid transport system substrate-binding protein